MSNKQETIGSIENFDEKSGNFLERLLFNNRKIVVSLCLMLTLFLGYSISGLSLNAAFEKMIPKEHPYIVNYLDHKKQLAGLGNSLRIAVAVKEGTIFDSEYLDTVRKINDELFTMGGVERPFMKSLWTPATRWIGVTEEGFDGGTVIPDGYDGSPESLQQVRMNVERSGEIGKLVASDYKSSIIMVPLLEKDPKTGEALDYSQFSRQVEELRSKYETDNIKLHITGFAKVVGDLIEGLEQMILFFALTILICGSVLYAYTRCMRITVIVVTSSLVAVIWLLGMLPILGYQLDPYSILVPFLVFAIGMSHGSQKMNGIMQDIGRGCHKLVAARYTFRRLFLTGMTALITDAVGFAVLMVIEIEVIQDLSIIASMGVLTLIITNLILLPILLSFTGVSKIAAERSYKAQQVENEDSEHKLHPIWQFFDKFTRLNYARTAVIVAMLLGTFGVIHSMQIQIGDLDPGAPELWPDSRYNKDNAFMVQNYAASSDTFIVMVKTEQYSCGKYENLIKVDSLEWKLQQLEGVISTSSLSAMSKIASAGMNEGSLKWYEIPTNQSLLNAIITRAPRELFNQNCDLLTLYVYLSDHKAETLQRVVTVVEQFAETNNAESIRFLSAAGNAGIEAATNIVVEKANTQMLVLVYLAVIILAYITFRSIPAVICTILPLMLTSILCQALMVELGIGIKVATLPVIALGVGIGVDYALYIMSVMLTCRKKGMNLADSYYSALVSTGKMVVLTGVTLGVAVLTWAFSPIKFQADMGLLLAFMFILNMLGALILVPALARFIMREPKVSSN
ncbi:MAG: MMPL family transporter [Colwellia sp.]|nr:MMPL family transporter [Colwellia sp.]